MTISHITFSWELVTPMQFFIKIKSTLKALKSHLKDHGKQNPTGIFISYEIY